MYDRLDNLIDVSKLASKSILLVGVGGVGASAFEILIRSGIKNITICDFDTYEESNLNRQLGSARSNLGMKKTEVLKKHALDINPDININIIDKFITKDTDIDLNGIDFIIDACDSIPAKVLLVKLGIDNNIPVIVSLGAGNRVNPSLLSVTKLSKVNGDPLGKKLRYELKKAQINANPVCVASSEVPIHEREVKSYMPVASYAGILLGDYVIKELLK